MERKKITFDSFIRGSIGCVLVVGILMLVERLSGVLLDCKRRRPCNIAPLGSSHHGSLLTIRKHEKK